MHVVRARVTLLVVALVFVGPAAHAAEPHWVNRIDSLVAGHHVSVAVGFQGSFIYRHDAGVRRRPASNEKLMLSMALLADLGPGFTTPTSVKATQPVPENGVLQGNLWLVGRGDPEVDRHKTSALAKRVVAAGVTRVRGRVKGATGYFAREKRAAGWQKYPLRDVPFPTALAFLENVGPSGGRVSDPERRAAASLTHQLERRGVRVAGRAAMGRPPSGLTSIASIDSARLGSIIRRMDVESINFDAEELAKMLAAERGHTPATFEDGAAAIKAFDKSNGVTTFEHHDGSGLSYDDRVTTGGIVRLLRAAEGATWLSDLRLALPRPGQGTLEGRLKGLRVRAKTGTLSYVSALSGWVWLDQEGAWAEFSIVSHGLTKDHAIRIEDGIVRTLERNAP
jgi:serine-type D-Ala-D-Ala carboxypeptidase/endopeptidase (penicillin-binding protein 4)